MWGRPPGLPTWQARPAPLLHQGEALLMAISTKQNWNETSAAALEDDRGGVEDTLTFYLQEMGSIPLLKPREERELVVRLDTVRRRYRRAAFFNAGMLSRVLETFERIRAGEQ